MAKKKSAKALRKLDAVAKKSKRGKASLGKKSAGRSTWMKRRKDVTDDDVEHVVKHGVREANALLGSKQGWIVKLAKRIRLAYDMLVAWWTGRFDFPKATVTALTLALLYFINPFDLIPDMLPIVGVVDDAMVFALVATMMATDARRYAKKFGLKLSDVGL